MRRHISIYVVVHCVLSLTQQQSFAQDCDGNGAADAIELANAEFSLTSITQTSVASREDLGASVDIDGDVAIVGAPRSSDVPQATGVSWPGRALIYRKIEGVWTVETVLTVDQPPFSREFGIDVAIHGNVVAVAARGLDPLIINAYIYIYRMQDSTWQLEQILQEPHVHGSVRNAIDLTDNSLIVASRPTTKIFEYQSGMWQMAASLSFPHLSIAQAEMVAIDGNTAAIGVRASASAGGNGILVAQRNTSGWEFVQFINPPIIDLCSGGSFGKSIDIDSDRIVAGYSQTNCTPEVQVQAAVFHRSPDGEFRLEQRLLAPDIDDSDNFGEEVSISGNRIAVSFEARNGLRAARVFELSSGVWHHQGDYRIDRANGPYFSGSGLAIDDSQLIIGNDFHLYYIDDEIQFWGDAHVYDLLANDCDNDGELDRCALIDADPDGDGQSVIDCNANGRLDACEMAERDCNGNGILDECDLGLVDGDAISSDCNGDAIPDECQLSEMDCNGNGTLDVCDLGFVPQLLDIPVGYEELDRRTLDIEGETLVVGLPRYDDLSVHEGRVLIYELRDTRWTIVQVLKAPSPIEFGEFGSQVSISGDLLAVSHPKFINQNGTGQRDEREIVIFRRENGWWVFDDILVSSNVEPNGSPTVDFGISIKLNDGRLVSSATTAVAQSPHVAVVFQRIDGQGWVIEEFLTENQDPSGEFLWRSVFVDLLGDTVLVSAVTSISHQSSMAAIFKRTETGYQQTALLTNPDLANDVFFGRGRLLSEDRLVVESRPLSSSQSYRGGLYLYRREGDSWRLSDSILNTTSLEHANGINSIVAATENLVIANKLAAVFDILGDRFRRRLENQLAEVVPVTAYYIDAVGAHASNLVFATRFSGSGSSFRLNVGVIRLDAPLDCNRNDLPDTCDATGDLNGDLAVTMDDIPGFVDRLLTNNYCSLADFNSDDTVDGRDIAPFVSALSMP